MKRIFGIYAFGLLALWVALSFSCGQRDLHSSESDPMNIEFSLTKLTQQDVYPGVNSNLMKTRNYVLKASFGLKSELRVAALLVDSVRLDPGFIKVDDKNQRGDVPVILPEGDHVIQANFAWNFYGNGPEMVEEFNPAPSGMKLEKGKAMLEVWVGEEMKLLDLGEITVLESIYAP
jgi:hypothetical protein